MDIRQSPLYHASKEVVNINRQRASDPDGVLTVVATLVEMAIFPNIQRQTISETGEVITQSPFSAFVGERVDGIREGDIIQRDDKPDLYVESYYEVENIQRLDLTQELQR